MKEKNNLLKKQNLKRLIHSKGLRINNSNLDLLIKYFEEQLNNTVDLLRFETITSSKKNITENEIKEIIKK